ncbi:MAG: hydrogenase expression/formation protein HypE [Chromatiales bacterium]|nr:hydrogenase expression/formation protein HypE [Chromatiales bacterium]
MMARLLETVFYPAFDNPALARRHDAARLALEGPVAFSTDAYVVQPLFFPGGDIGSLAVSGTINDLAMAGARARYLSAAFILEEGLPVETLRRIVRSMRSAAFTDGVEIVAGDIKVVERGKADGCFITTAGVGSVLAPTAVEPQALRPGDLILLSGDIGRHGIAVLSARESFGFEEPVESDCASLLSPVMALLEAGVALHCLRDLTRGGLASVLVELAQGSGLELRIEESAVPVRADVRAACELFGLDPLYVANEGRFVAVVPAAARQRALELLARFPVSAGAIPIGSVVAGEPGRVIARGALGQDRVIDLLSGEQLPRIC